MDLTQIRFAANLKININSKYIVLIGPTGAGKSTIANIIQYPNKVGTKLVNKYKIQYVPPQDSPFKMSSKLKSETNIPNIGNKVIDCPGFNDTNIQKELPNSIMIKKVLQACVKVIIVTTFASFQDQRGNHFRELWQNLNKAFDNRLNGVVKTKCFALCLSKAKQCKALELIQKNQLKINQFLMQQLEFPQQKQFIKGLEDRIFLFKDSEKPSQFLKKINLIQSKMEYIQSSTFPVKVSISDKGQNSLRKLIQKILGEIVDYDKSLVQEYLNQISLKWDIQKHSYETMKKNIKNYNPQKHKIKIKFETLIKNLINAKNIKSLVSILKQNNNILENNKLILPNSYQNQLLEFISYYPKANEFSNQQTLKFVQIFNKLINFCKDKQTLLNQCQQADNNWVELNEATKPSTLLKVIAVVGLVVGSIALIFSTGGIILIQFAFIAVTETFLLTNLGIAGVGLVASGAGAIAEKVLQIRQQSLQKCKDYQQKYPQIVPISKKIIQFCQNQPPKIAAKWLKSKQNFKQTKYLTNFYKILLIQVRLRVTDGNNLFD